jgi:hypothetical protein
MFLLINYFFLELLKEEEVLIEHRLPYHIVTFKTMLGTTFLD